MSQTFDLLRSLIGKPVWGVRRSNGSSFFVEFGSPRLSIREASSDMDTRLRLPALAKRRITPIGEYSMLILDCFWNIAHDGLSTDESADQVDIDKAISSLDSTYFLDFEENVGDETVTTLNFDNGTSLLIRSNSEANSEDNWNIRLPDGRVLALCPDGSLQ